LLPPAFGRTGKKASLTDAMEPLPSALRSARILLQPFEPRAAADGFSCTVHVRRQARALLLHYCVKGPHGHLAVPAASGRPGPAPGLWRTTCMECFIRPAISSAYTEWNLSPSGNWWACAFESCRIPARRQPDGLRPLRMRTRQSAGQLIVQSALPLADGAALSISPAVVLEHEHGVLSYWAIAHPFDQPDFHRGPSIALSL